MSVYVDPYQRRRQLPEVRVASNEAALRYPLAYQGTVVFPNFITIHVSLSRSASDIITAHFLNFLT